MKRNSMTAATKLVAVVGVLLAATLVVGPLPAARDGKPPRIVAAAMQDVGRRRRVPTVCGSTYSERSSARRRP